MLLAIDLGNTSIHLAVLKNSKVIKVYYFDKTISTSAFKIKLLQTLKIIKRNHNAIADIIVCSVVPPLNHIVRGQIKNIFKINPLFVGEDIIVPIKNNYKNPKQVGQDRLVCAYATKCLYGAPAIVIDLGTAITLDAVSKSGAYEGGIIVPGIRLSFESLFRKTALLPKINNIEAPRKLIGKDTVTSMLSGIFYGYGEMLVGLIDRISRQLKGRPRVIVTGGYLYLMKRFIAHKIHKIDRDLVFKGMALLSSK